MISDTTSSTYKEWQHTRQGFTATATCKAHIQRVSHDVMLIQTYTMQEQQISNQHVDVLLVQNTICKGQMLTCISNHQKLTFEYSTEPIGQDEEGVWNSFRLRDGATNGC